MVDIALLTFIQTIIFFCSGHRVLIGSALASCKVFTYLLKITLNIKNYFFLQHVLLLKVNRQENFRKFQTNAHISIMRFIKNSELKMVLLLNDLISYN